MQLIPFFRENSYFYRYTETELIWKREPSNVRQLGRSSRIGPEIFQKTIAIQLWIEGSKAKYYYDKIYVIAYDDSMDTLPKGTEWMRLDEKKSSCVNLAFSCDYLDQRDWPRQFQWLYDNLIVFKDFFAPYVKSVK